MTMCFSIFFYNAFYFYVAVFWPQFNHIRNYGMPRESKQETRDVYIKRILPQVCLSLCYYYYIL